MVPLERFEALPGGIVRPAESRGHGYRKAARVLLTTSTVSREWVESEQRIDPFNGTTIAQVLVLSDLEIGSFRRRDSMSRVVVAFVVEGATR